MSTIKSSLYLYQFCRLDVVREGEAPAEPGAVINGNNAGPIICYSSLITFYGSAGASPSRTD